jgi:hypothetical protein
MQIVRCLSYVTSSHLLGAFPVLRPLPLQEPLKLESSTLSLESTHQRALAVGRHSGQASGRTPWWGRC